jgi:hypothetical protein
VGFTERTKGNLTLMSDTADTVKVKKPKKNKPPKTDQTPAYIWADYNLSAPGSGSSAQFIMADHTDALLLVTPRGIREETTTYGTSEVVEADIVVLNQSDPASSDEYPGAWIFAKVVIGQLRGPLEKKSRVVGTLIQDQASQKKGQSAPYRLTAPSEADIDVAKRYLDSLNPLR